MSKPRLLMLDEPSMGLAPILVEQIFDIIQELNQHGTTILLVEQNARWPCLWPTGAMCWRQARSSPPAPARSCWRTRQ